MLNHTILNVFSNTGLCATFMCNVMLIILTVCFIKKITGTYKKMVVGFSIMGTSLSLAEYIARPFAHNYNDAMIILSINTWIESKTLRQMAVAIWVDLYVSVIIYISVQFVYRYIFLANKKWQIKFDDMWSITWILYSLTPGTFYAVFYYIYCAPDDYAQSYLLQEISENYEMAMPEVPGFVMLMYASDGSIRLKDLSFLILASLIISSHYLVIIYCGVKMHFKIKSDLETLSEQNKKQQIQIFKALVVQCITPTVCMFFPALPILGIPLLSPYIQGNISLQTGWLYPFMINKFL